MRVASFIPFVAALLIVAATSHSSVDQAKPAGPCDTGACRDFDFRQHFVESVDVSGTWTKWFDGYCSRL